jgi:hypothetical protein
VCIGNEPQVPEHVPASALGHLLLCCLTVAISPSNKVSTTRGGGRVSKQPHPAALRQAQVLDKRFLISDRRPISAPTPSGRIHGIACLLDEAIGLSELIRAAESGDTLRIDRALRRAYGEEAGG